MTAIKDLLVVEFAEGVAGPCCGLQFADLGARVIKIEQPDGDRAREWGPPMAGDDAAIFSHLNRGKQSVVLDLERADDWERLRAIVASADAVVAQNDPGAAHQPDWRHIASENPRLVVCELDDFGPKGPHGGAAGSELTIQAMSGFTRYVGEPGGAPCRVGFEIAWMATAMHAYQALAAALLYRDETGQGQYARISGLNSLLSMKTILLAVQTGGMDEWNGFHLNGPHWPPDTGWDTKDGQITFDFRHEQKEEWVAFCEKVELSHLPSHPDYQDWRSTIYIGDRRFEFGEPYRKVFAQMTCAEASAIINDLDGISVKFHDYGEMLSHPQVQLLDALVDVPDAPVTAQRQVGFPFRYDGEKRRTQFSRAPRLGEHTAAVLAEFVRTSDTKRVAATGGGR
jgi:crotonobetainyl-CoA:carnitine CoA-transferase CaiB-like acyl-CoA transferase